MESSFSISYLLVTRLCACECVCINKHLRDGEIVQLVKWVLAVQG